MMASEGFDLSELTSGDADEKLCMDLDFFIKVLNEDSPSEVRLPIDLPLSLIRTGLCDWVCFHFPLCDFTEVRRIQILFP